MLHQDQDHDSEQHLFDKYTGYAIQHVDQFRQIAVEGFTREGRGALLLNWNTKKLIYLSRTTLLETVGRQPILDRWRSDLEDTLAI